MKLNFLFILMDLATLAAIPVVYMMGKFRQLSKIMEIKTFTTSTSPLDG